MTEKECKSCIELNNIAHQGQIDFLEKELQFFRGEKTRMEQVCTKYFLKNEQLTQQNKQMREKCNQLAIKDKIIKLMAEDIKTLNDDYCFEHPDINGNVGKYKTSEEAIEHFTQQALKHNDCQDCAVKNGCIILDRVNCKRKVTITPLIGGE